MDHSVQAYLKRMSTEKLEAALRYYLQEDPGQDPCYEVMAILGELKRRFVPGKLSPQERQAWERFQKNLMKEERDNL